MAKRNKKSKASGFATLVGVGVLFYLAARWDYGLVLSTASRVLLGIGMALLWVSLLLIWVSFVMPTYCDYTTLRGSGCTRPVRGKLRGCWTHSRLKRDALWAALGLRNPGRVVRTTWQAPPEPLGYAIGYPRRTSPAPVTPVERSPQGARSAVIFGCTVLSGATGLVSAAAGVIAVV